MTNNENQNNINNTNNKNKKKLFIILALLGILLLVAIIFPFAYAKFISTINASASAEVAKMICEIEVLPSENTSTIINPYCTVTVKNYNDKNEITETDINYKIEVLPKGDFTLPEYYWKDSEGTILAHSTALTGSFKNGLKDLKEYKIIFLNSGEEDITRLVDFNLVAIQANE